MALDHARTIGLPAVRAGTVGTDPRFVAFVRDLVLERVGLARPGALAARSVARRLPGHPAPNPRGEQPSLSRRLTDRIRCRWRDRWVGQRGGGQDRDREAV